MKLRIRIDRVTRDESGRFTMWRDGYRAEATKDEVAFRRGDDGEIFAIADTDDSTVAQDLGYKTTLVGELA